MRTLDFPDQFDWRGCSAVEFNPLKLSGRATVGSSRMDADGVLVNFDAGMSAEDIAQMFQVDLEPVKEVIAFALRRRLRATA